MNSAVEWVRIKNTIIAYNMIGYYYNSPPNSTSQYQYGFCQINRRKIRTENCTNPTSSILPATLSVMIAYTPIYSCNYEEGKFMYPIILNNFQLGSLFYYYPYDLYIYYLEVSFCQPPVYFINVLYNFIIEKHSLVFQLRYCHELVQTIAPINYTWKLHSVTYIVGGSATVMQSYCTLNDMITELFESMDNKKVEDLLPEALLFYFCDNYVYNFGLNLGLNGSFPSNNTYNCEIKKKDE